MGLFLMPENQWFPDKATGLSMTAWLGRESGMSRCISRSRALPPLDLKQKTRFQIQEEKKMYVQHPYKYEGKYYAKIDGVFYEISKEVAMAMFAEYRNLAFRNSSSLNLFILMTWNRRIWQKFLVPQKEHWTRDLIRFSERCEICTWKHTVAVNRAMTKERLINSGSYDLVRIIKMDI